MGAVAAAIDLLGVEALVDPGTWGAPFVVRASEDEIEILVSLLDEAAPEEGFNAVRGHLV